MIKIFTLLLITIMITFSYAENLEVKFNTKEESFSVTGEVNERLLERFTTKVMTHKLPYMKIYFDSPGGDLLSMSRIIEVLDNSNIKFVCVARFAASAAFMIFEHCDIRIILNGGGILMSHNASGVLMGQIPQMRNQLNAIEAIIKKEETAIAQRLKMSYKNYVSLIANDLWITSENARKYNAVDYIINKISCSVKLVNERETRFTDLCSLFGCVTKEQEFSLCPLLTLPLKKEEK